MTVKDLIEKLKLLPPRAPIQVCHNGDDRFFDLVGVTWSDDGISMLLIVNPIHESPSP